MAVHPIIAGVFADFGLTPKAPVAPSYKGEKIITSHDYPPIPIRSFDWSAVLDGYDGAPDAGFQPVGTGATEAEAIADLIDQLEAA